MDFHPQKFNVLDQSDRPDHQVFSTTPYCTAHRPNLRRAQLKVGHIGVTWETRGQHYGQGKPTTSSCQKKHTRSRSRPGQANSITRTLMRPHMEYAATVWDPHISKEKHSLEMFQRRAARWVTNRFHNTSVSQICFTP